MCEITITKLICNGHNHMVCDTHFAKLKFVSLKHIILIFIYFFKVELKQLRPRTAYLNWAIPEITCTSPKATRDSQILYPYFPLRRQGILRYCILTFHFPDKMKKQNKTKQTKKKKKTRELPKIVFAFWYKKWDFPILTVFIPRKEKL